MSWSPFLFSILYLYLKFMSNFGLVTHCIEDFSLMLYRWCIHLHGSCFSRESLEGIFGWVRKGFFALLDKLSYVKDVMPNFDFLQLKGSTGSSRQHVHGCSLVRARKFYGYCSFEEFFVKIYLYPDVYTIFYSFCNMFSHAQLHIPQATCMYKLRW